MPTATAWRNPSASAGSAHLIEESVEQGPSEPVSEMNETAQPKTASLSPLAPPELFAKPSPQRPPSGIAAPW